jgi:hypothetical protein
MRRESLMRSRSGEGGEVAAAAVRAALPPPSIVGSDDFDERDSAAALDPAMPTRSSRSSMRELGDDVDDGENAKATAYEQNGMSNVIFIWTGGGDGEMVEPISHSDGPRGGPTMSSYVDFTTYLSIYKREREEKR